MNKRFRTVASIVAAVVVAGGVAAATEAVSTTYSGGGAYTAVSTYRALDTRSTAPVAAGKDVSLSFSAPVPADATAVVLNVTATDIKTSGYLSADSSDDTTPKATSTVNFSGAGQSVANTTTVQLGKDGKVDVWNFSGSTLDVVVDVLGYFETPTVTAAPAVPVVNDLGGMASVPTGGSFNSLAPEVGTFDLTPGTYQVVMNAKVTPIVQANAATQVFPSLHLYNQVKNANFSGDVLDVGGSALESGAYKNVDSNYSGTAIVTVAADTTFHVYGFGYDSDTGAGSYQLDDLSVTVVQIG
jgi:hypothetical protein